MPVSKRDYVHVIDQLDGEVMDCRQKFDVGWRELAKRDRKIEEINFKVL